MDPIQKWQLATNSTEGSNPDQVEIWPIPVAAQTVRFEGQRNVLTLSANSDKADLDDLLLVYWVAADYLALRQQPNAALQLKKAMDHLTKLRASYPVDNDPPIHIGGGTSYGEKRHKNIHIIAVAS